MRSFGGAGASSRTRRSRTRPMRCSCVRRMRMRASASIDVAAARAAKGVVAVLTHKEIEAAGVGSTSLHPPLVGRNGAKLIVPFRPALAAERVMHVGQPVALVVAESIALAQDAAEQVAVEYEELDSVAEVRAAHCGGRAAALSGGARQCRDRLDRSVRTTARTRAKSKRSSPVRRMSRAFTAVNQRLVVASMEPRGATALVRRGERSLHAALLLAGRGPAARPAHRHDGLAEGKAARHHRGCRRRVRAEDLGLSGISEPARRREAHRPAGRLDGDALGVVPVRPAGARHRNRSRACHRPEGQIPRAAREAHRQHGRLRRRAGRAHPDQQFRALLSRHVRDPAHPGRRAVRVHQHGADRALSRRRPAGGELRAGAAGRRGGARHRHRSDPAAAAQSHSAQVDPLQDRGRHDL